MATIDQPTRMENGVSGLDTRNEFERLATFDRWPLWATQKSYALAQYGFYYTGSWDKVVCFSCRGEIGNWGASDSVEARHRETFPNCSFVQGRDRNNVAMGTAAGGGNIDDASLWHPGSKKQATKDKQHFKPQSKNNNSKKAPSLSASATSSRSGDSIQEAGDLLEGLRSLGAPSPSSCPGSNSRKSAPVVSSSAPGGEAPASPPPSDSPTESPVTEAPVRLEGNTPGSNELYESGNVTEPDLSLVTHEAYRLRTFVGKWSDNYFVPPVDLAKAGFFYRSAPDRVQCAFCKGRLLNWASTDVPMDEHRKHFPNCAFVKGRNVGNVPVEVSNSSVQFPAEKRDNPTPDRLGIVTGRARHPHYTLESARLESLQTWPDTHVLAPSTLAKAGFFYVGFSDNVKCFYCDGGLRNWEAGDDPWREHARWFSKCGFLQLSKGDEYIQGVLADTRTQGNSLNRSVARLRQEEELSKSLDTPMVRAVINMGYSKEFVRRVIEKHRRNSGGDFTGAEELFEAVLEAHQQKETTPEHQSSGDTQQREEPSSIETLTGQSGRVPEESVPATSSPEQSRKRKKNKNKKKSKPANEPASSENGPPEQSSSLENSALVVEDEGVKALMKEYQRIREERLCKICMDEECTVVFLPCGHLVCCPSCAPAVRTCPICRQLIKGSVRISEAELKDMPSLTA